MIKLKSAVTLGIASLLASNCTQAYGAEASAGVDFSTAYIFRGVTLNEGVVAQPYVEVGGEGLGGFTLGVWGNLDLEKDEARAIQSGQFSEVDLYASYNVPLESDALGLAIGYTEYTYPHAATGVDADREFNLIAELDTALSPYLGLYYGVDGPIDEQWYLQAGVGHEVEISEVTAVSLGASVAYINPDIAKDGISHVALSAGLDHSFISAGVTWYIETDDEVLVVDEEVVGTLGISHAF